MNADFYIESPKNKISLVIIRLQAADNFIKSPSRTALEGGGRSFLCLECSIAVDERVEDRGESKSACLVGSHWLVICNGGRVGDVSAYYCS